MDYIGGLRVVRRGLGWGLRVVVVKRGTKKQQYRYREKRIDTDTATDRHRQQKHPGSTPG